MFNSNPICHHHLVRFLMSAACLSASALAAYASEFASTINLSSLDGTTGFRLDGVAANDESGRTLSGAGDFNGDGIGDVIIGASSAGRNAQSENGASYVVFGKSAAFAPAINLSVLDGSNGFRLDGVLQNDHSGRAVSSAGDFNGDGFDDVIIGAYLVSPLGVRYAGSSYVVFGKAKGFASISELAALDGSDGFRLDGALPGDGAGFAVSAAGDVNGDAFADLIVAARSADPGGKDLAGSSYVIFGKPGAIAPIVNLSELDGTTGFRLDGVAAGDLSGRSVSSAGDINGDGFADMVVGAYRADPNGLDYAGSSYLLFGKAGGFEPVIDLASLNGTSGFRIDGAAENDRAGHSVSGAGDVNGDDFDDFIVGAYKASPDGKAAAGSSYVVFGKAENFASIINVSELDGLTGFRLDGVMVNDHSGAPVSGAGDINGDGFADLIVAAYAADPPGLYAAGSSYVVFGKNGSFASSIKLSALDGTTGFRLDGAAALDISGFSVSDAGDVNGDGFADILVGANNADPNGQNAAGSSFVVFGRAPLTPVVRFGSDAKQYISGGPEKDVLWGGPGDVLEGREGGDLLAGSATASYQHASGPVTANLVNPVTNSGDAAGDAYASIVGLVGSAFADTLVGDSKANTIAGGKGKDRMKGGGGKDTFAYTSSNETGKGRKADIILSFDPGTAATAIDKIDLSAMDANPKVNGNQAFTFRGTRPFTGAGQIRLKKTATGIVIQGNTRGAKVPEFEIVLKGLRDLSRLTTMDFSL